MPTESLERRVAQLEMETSVQLDAIKSQMGTLSETIIALSTGVTSQLSEQNRRIEGVESSMNALRVELEHKIEASNNRTLVFIGLMFAAAGLIVGLIVYLT